MALEVMPQIINGDVAPGMPTGGFLTPEQQARVEGRVLMPANGSGFSTQDLGDVITAGNDLALQWWAITHHTDVPTRNPGIYTPLPGGGSIAVNPNTLVLLVLGVVALIIFAKA